MRARRDDLHVLTGSYALDALDGAERDDFERHLHRCPSCEAEVRGLRETAARLALAEAVQPPAAVQQRVLTTAYRIRQLPPVPGRGRSRRPDLAGRRLLAERLLTGGSRARGPRLPRLAQPRPGQGRPGQHGHWLPGGRSRLAAALAAVSVAVAVTLGAVELSTQHQLQEARASGAAIARVVAAPDARVEKLATSAGGVVTVVVSADQQAAVVSIRGMAALPSGRTYQLWVMTPGGGARSAGLLPGTGRGGPELASDVRRGDRLGITVEPAGGTSRPTTAPVVVIPATA